MLHISSAIQLLEVPETDLLELDSGQVTLFAQFEVLALSTSLISAL